MNLLDMAVGELKAEATKLRNRLPKRTARKQKAKGPVRRFFGNIKQAVASRIERIQDRLGWINLWLLTAVLGWGVATLGEHLSLPELKLIGLGMIIISLTIHTVSRRRKMRKAEHND